MNNRNWGGARPNSGPKPYPIDAKRVLALREQGLSQAKIAERFGVSRDIICGVLRREGKRAA